VAANPRADGDVGHAQEAYAEPAFRNHLLGGIRWAAGDAFGNCRA
jgi:hypothetical protein